MLMSLRHLVQLSSYKHLSHTVIGSSDQFHPSWTWREKNKAFHPSISECIRVKIWYIVVAWRRIHDHQRKHTAYKRRFSWWCPINWNGQWDKGEARYQPLLRIDNGIIDYILTSNSREHYKGLRKGFSCLSHDELTNVEAIFMVAMKHVPQYQIKLISI